MFSTQQYFGFDPKTIPDCQLWLDAADRSTITLSGQNVTAWRDKSGLNNNASAVGTIPFTSNINGITTPAFTLQANTYFTGTTANTGNTLTAFAVYIQSNTSTGNSRIVSMGRSGVDWNVTSNVAAILMFSSSFCSYRNSSLLSTITGTFGVPSLSVALFTGSSNTFFLNGTAGTTVASSGNFDYTTYRIATAFGEESASTLSGTVGEVIIYNSALTTSQRQQVEGYLAWKWGLQTNLPTGHPNKTYPTTMRAFQPTDVSNCILWLDGADSSTLSFSSGSNVSQWRDKSGNGLNFSTTSGTPTYTSNTLTIPSGAIMTSSASISLTTNTYVYIVSQLTTVNSFNMLLAFSGINPSGNTGDFSIRFTTSGLGGTAANPGGVNDFANGRYYVNGVSNPSTVTVSTYTVTNLVSGQSINSGTTALTISSSFFSRFFIGNVYEILIYSSVPTNSQRQQVEGYLAAKWRLSSSLPTTHPTYLLRAVPSTSI